MEWVTRDRKIVIERSPERPDTKYPLRPALGLAGLSIAALFLMAMAAPGHGQEQATIAGQVVNGTSGGAAPANLEVTLHIFSNGGGADTETALTDGDGRFQFPKVGADGDSVYAVTTRYREVLYSSRLDPLLLEEPVELLVYETTSSLEDVAIEADVVLISGADMNERLLSAFEVVEFTNGGDRTFVPDLDEPARMSFMRFSFPAGATGLDVTSDLPGGEIITLDTGFALTAPVTPGSHRVTYSYGIPYKGSRLELVRSSPMGARSFRLLVEDSLAALPDSSVLTALPPAGVQEKSYRVWGTTKLSPGTRIRVEMEDLPQPSTQRRLGDALTDGPYLKIGIPVAVGVLLAGILLYATVFRRQAAVPAAPDGPGVAVAADNVSEEGDGPTHREHRSLIDSIARLDDLYQRGEVAEEDYRRRRQQYKDRLRQLVVTFRG